MKKLSRLVCAVAFLFFASCEKDDAVLSNDQNNTVSEAKTGSRYMAFGDIMTISHVPTRKFFTGESNGDATINKTWSTTSPWLNSVWMPWARFKIVNPNNPTSTAQVKTGDEVAFKCLNNNLYITAESWDDDVSVNRTAIGPWEKWKIYAPSNTTVGNLIFYGSVDYMSFVSLESVWGKYLRPDASGFAKAGAPFDSTVSVLSNPNSFQLTRE
ncbi:fascin domain-containing protein [Flavobacterium humi]|uniref:Uncharacterized protein n=1 Tax=Flavobacterium humi TaxID=2562683 RepID=A0A4Z0LCN9_9FLAO|nr:hypothetical protein [Flavobacterium humi]TGD59659.1 hypothetical protein E4635_01630 [Flavobacterium humi]